MFLVCVCYKELINKDNFKIEGKWEIPDEGKTGRIFKVGSNKETVLGLKETTIGQEPIQVEEKKKHDGRFKKTMEMWTRKKVDDTYFTLVNQHTTGKLYMNKYESAKASKKRSILWWCDGNN